ncbi:putative DNA polymerase iota [Rhizodiscina lignyota]|uniref:DNA polymerase iota n=1 Tax=Rhizodiscina lignyota TaxID=1504668 RepID=A0A9P4M3E6_9PEZI|nr:putative DNA polymerase iota [Rhizodiscina lignyota]
MSSAAREKLLKRKDDRIIVHFDYDCFYASVFEAENPKLKSLPLAVKQKQIIVTCNYEARRRGLHKLQLITEAKKICPEVIIVLGEDISRFRDASKELYSFLRSFSWNGNVERLGFDEVWMDTTDMVDYNVSILNRNDLVNSFFCLAKDDPTVGFAFDATAFAGHTYAKEQPDANAHSGVVPEEDSLYLRLRLASHLARYLRVQLEEQKGYTSTVGISTSKLLSKLVGNVNKPKAQTTLAPPYTASEARESNVTSFIDAHEVGKIPGIGFKLATKIRSHVLQKLIDEQPFVLDRDKDIVTCGQVRNFPGMSADLLEKLLSGPGSPHGIGAKIWHLLHGIDDSQVGQARGVPRQISIEDSYVRLDTYDEVLKELGLLSRSLLRRMRIDLLDDGDSESSTFDAPHDNLQSVTSRRWLAHPRTLRLSTRPRLASNQDGSRSRAIGRISRSGPLANFVFNLSDSIDAIADKLVSETLVPMFRRLHPEKSGWNLSLVNLAVMNMAEAASDKGNGARGVGRNISNMFRRQEDVLKEWKNHDTEANEIRHGSEDFLRPSQASVVALDQDWDYGDDMAEDDAAACEICGSRMPIFALSAHERFHSAGE